MKQQPDNNGCLTEFLLKTFQGALGSGCEVLSEMMETKAELLHAEKFEDFEGFEKKSLKKFSCVYIYFDSPYSDVAGVVSVIVNSEYLESLRGWSCKGDEYLIDSISIEDFLYEFGNIYLNHVMAVYSKNIGVRLVYSFPKLITSARLVKETLDMSDPEDFPVSFLGNLSLDNKVKVSTIISFETSKNTDLESIVYDKAS